MVGILACQGFDYPLQEVDDVEEYEQQFPHLGRVDLLVVDGPLVECGRVLSPIIFLEHYAEEIDRIESPEGYDFVLDYDHFFSRLYSCKIFSGSSFQNEMSNMVLMSSTVRDFPSS